MHKSGILFLLDKEADLTPPIHPMFCY